MTPNQITGLRVVLALVAIALFRHNVWAAALAVLLTAIAILLDGVDGYVARRSGRATPVGAAFDILGDRIVEDSYLIFYAASGLISFWVPVVFIVRGAATDFLRALAQTRGLTPFGKSGGMLHSWWGRVLVGSRWSRASYGALKMVLFCHLGVVLFLRSAAADLGTRMDPSFAVLMDDPAMILTYASLTFCIVRGIPVLWEGRWLLEDASALRGAA
jgi:phosphatidylglycerophosphate synthase